MRPLLLMMMMMMMMMLCGTPAWAGEGPAEQDECAHRGPAYWCRSLATALRCGALRLCLRQGRGGPLGGHGEDSCQDCKQVVTLLIRLAKESRFQKALRTYLEEKCDALPVQTLVPRCRTLVDTYYDLFVTRLEDQVKPDLLCAKVGLCSSNPLGPPDISSPELSPELEQMLWPQQGQDPILSNSQVQGSPGEDLPIPLPMCWLCRNFVGKVESLIPKATVGKSMSQLCHLLPLALTGMCECMVERYSVILVDMLVRKLGPDLICGMIGMCATDGNCEQEMPQGAPAVPVGRCQACLGISNQVKAALKANSTREEVEVALILACAKTSFLDWQECESFLRRHQAQLFRLLQKPWDSKTMCQELGDCMAQEEPFGPSFACAQGPAYWCSSLRTAEECKATQHCQAHVWL